MVSIHAEFLSGKKIKVVKFPKSIYYQPGILHNLMYLTKFFLKKYVEDNGLSSTIKGICLPSNEA